MAVLTQLASDSRLVRRALEHDSSAVEELVLRYQRKAYGIARAIAQGSTVQVEDIVQEAFFQTLRDLRQLRQPERFRAWFLTILRNVARHQVTERRPGPHPDVNDMPLSDRQNTASERLESRELRSRLWQEVDRLPESVREAIYLFYHDGESVRRVAATLDISGAAVKKRLQKGRDLLRESLWRELGDHLRDSLPASREWRRRARSTTLVAVCALPALRATPAAAATSTAAITSASTTAMSSLGLLTGAAIMSKYTATVLGVIVLLSTGVAITLLKDDDTPQEVSQSAVFREATVPLSEHQRLQRELEDTRRRLRELEGQARRLTRAPVPKKAGHLAPPATRPTTPSSGSGLDWSAYTSLFAECLPLLRAGGEQTVEEQAKLAALRVELLRLAASARDVSDSPLFDEAIFSELLAAVFTPLDLSDDQLDEVDASTAALFDQVPEDPSALDPLGRFRLKEEMAQHVSDTMAEVLDQEQAENWDAVWNYMERFFLEGNIQTTGIEKGPEQLSRTLQRYHDLDERQSESIRPWGEEYTAAAREILERYARNSDELKALSPKRKRELDAEFMELQHSYEERLSRILSEEQKAEAWRKRPLVLRFQYGRGSKDMGYRPGEF